MATICDVCGRPVVDVDVWLADDDGATCCDLRLAQDRCHRLGYERERVGRINAEARADDLAQRLAKQDAELVETRRGRDAARELLNGDDVTAFEMKWEAARAQEAAEARAEAAERERDEERHVYEHAIAAATEVNRAAEARAVAAEAALAEARSLLERERAAYQTANGAAAKLGADLDAHRAALTEARAEAERLREKVDAALLACPWCGGTGRHAVVTGFNPVQGEIEEEAPCPICAALATPAAEAEKGKP